MALPGFALAWVSAEAPTRFAVCEAARGLLAGLVTLDDLLGLIAEELRATVAAIEAEQARETRMRR